MAFNRGGAEERRWGERNMRGLYWGCLGGLMFWIVVGMALVLFFKAT